MNGIRWVIICMGPAFVVWAFISTLFREISRAPRYAWLEARSEFETWKRLWKEWDQW